MYYKDPSHLQLYRMSFQKSGYNESSMSHIQWCSKTTEDCHPHFIKSSHCILSCSLRSGLNSITPYPFVHYMQKHYCHLISCWPLSWYICCRNGQNIMPIQSRNCEWESGDVGRMYILCFDVIRSTGNML